MADDKNAHLSDEEKQFLNHLGDRIKGQHYDLEEIILEIQKIRREAPIGHFHNHLERAERLLRDAEFTLNTIVVDNLGGPRARY